MTPFAGFVEPRENWSKLPHSFVEAFPLLKGEAEIKVIIYVLRHTWGYQEDKKRISIDEFAHGRKRQNGGRLDNGTGLSKNAIKRGIKLAVEHGFLEVEEDRTDRARIKRFYRLRMQKVSEPGLIPGGSNSDPLMSENDPRGSESDPRTKKDTIKKEKKRKTTSGNPSVVEDGRVSCSLDDDLFSFFRGINITKSVIPELIDASKEHGQTLEDLQGLWLNAQVRATQNPQGLLVTLVRAGQRPETLPNNLVTIFNSLCAIGFEEADLTPGSEVCKALIAHRYTADEIERLVEQAGYFAGKSTVRDYVRKEILEGDKPLSEKEMGSCSGFFSSYVGPTITWS